MMLQGEAYDKVVVFWLAISWWKEMDEQLLLERIT